MVGRSGFEPGIVSHYVPLCPAPITGHVQGMALGTQDQPYCSYINNRRDQRQLKNLGAKLRSCRLSGWGQGDAGKTKGRCGFVPAWLNTVATDAPLGFPSSYCWLCYLPPCFVLGSSLGRDSIFLFVLLCKWDPPLWKGCGDGAGPLSSSVWPQCFLPPEHSLGVKGL